MTTFIHAREEKEKRKRRTLTLEKEMEKKKDLLCMDMACEDGINFGLDKDRLEFKTHNLTIALVSAIRVIPGCMEIYKKPRCPCPINLC
jgi:hypothetical protein